VVTHLSIHPLLMNVRCSCAVSDSVPEQRHGPTMAMLMRRILGRNNPTMGRLVDLTINHRTQDFDIVSWGTGCVLLILQQGLAKPGLCCSSRRGCCLKHYYRCPIAS